MQQSKSFSDIVRAKCAEYGLRPELVLSKARRGVVVKCRKEIYQEAYETGKWSLSQMARFTNRDHATVIHHLEKKMSAQADPYF